jgi:hypothetical protein
MAKSKYNALGRDKIKHKVVSYFILRKLAERMPLGLAKKLTHLLMTSKELLDKIGLGNFEEEDIKANKKGIEEASEDVINKRPYRYKGGTKKIVKDLLLYLHLKK